MWRSTEEGWMHASSSGSMTMRPAASSSRMVRSERITAARLLGAPAPVGAVEDRSAAPDSPLDQLADPPVLDRSAVDHDPVEDGPGDHVDEHVGIEVSG